MYDVVIVGGGIIGSSVAYRLSRYHLSVLLVERNPVFADETSKGNSGVIHGGFDPDPRKIEARLNVLGNRLWQTEIFRDLRFPRAKLDSLVIAFSDAEMDQVRMLYDRGIANGVNPADLRIVNRQQLLDKEPNLNPNAVGALLCTSSWAIDPVQASLAFLGAANANGTELWKNAQVTAITPRDEGFDLKINGNITVRAKNVINAAGHYADAIAAMAGYPDFTQTTRRGEYRILDRTLNGIVGSICFMVPTIHGKGVIVSPMLDGHVLVGPTAEEGVAKEDTRLVTREKYNYIGEIGTKLVPGLDLSRTIMTVAGSRPIDVATNDFVIRHAEANDRFINLAGMQSPALASAPAIALEAERLLAENGTALRPKAGFNPKFAMFH